MLVPGKANALGSSALSGDNESPWRRSELLTVPTGRAPQPATDHGASLQLVVTVLGHSEARRIGEVHVSSKTTMGLSRAAPDFAKVGSDDSLPLADPMISRTPIELSIDARGALSINTSPAGPSLVVDGQRAGRQVVIERGQLEGAGTVLLIADRVCLHVARRAPGPTTADIEGMVGGAASMVRLAAEVERVCCFDVPVLLRGETGTGKELVARALHAKGLRCDGPFVSVNAAALTPTVAASELFGHRAGAFTGAAEDRAGLFERADGGTLFLDEIGEAPPAIQTMLLRTLETRTVQRVGEADERSIDVRLIAATDADLEEMVTHGSFRAALLHRLQGYEIVLPPLRMRREDIGRLLVHWLLIELEAVGAKDVLFDAGPEDEPWLPTPVVDRLARFDWPGNVRQLRNVARWLAVRHAEGRVAPSPELERILTAQSASSPTASEPAASVAQAAGKKERRRPRTVSEEELVASLVEHGWRLKPSAEALTITRSSIYVLLERFPRVAEARKIPAEALQATLQEVGDDLAEASRRLDVPEEIVRIRVQGRKALRRL